MRQIQVSKSGFRRISSNSGASRALSGRITLGPDGRELGADFCSLVALRHLMRPAGYHLAPEASRKELFKYAKVMACITTATSTFVMFRYSQLILHKLGVSKIINSASHTSHSRPYRIHFSALHIQSSFFLANRLSSDSSHDRDVT